MFLPACIVKASETYHVPVAAIETVIAAPHPAGGIGPMGIPADWLPTLARYGFNPGLVQADHCVNIRAGAWIISINPRSRIVPVQNNPQSPSEPPLPQCAVEAAAEYRVPYASIYRVLAADQTGGAGPMGIPLNWLPTLTHYGFNSDLVLHDRCMGLIAGEWILGVERLQDMAFQDKDYPVPVDAMINPPAWLLPMVLRAAAAVKLPPALVLAVAAQESHFHPYETSPMGAQGLMQLMPGTAATEHVADPYDPSQSLMGGAEYLATLNEEFGGDLPLVLAAYNAGDQAVKAYGHKIPPFLETERYVPEVLQRLAFYKAKLDASGNYTGPVEREHLDQHSRRPAGPVMLTGVLIRPGGLVSPGATHSSSSSQPDFLSSLVAAK